MANLTKRQRRLVNEAVRTSLRSLGLDSSKQEKKNTPNPGQHKQRGVNEKRPALGAWIAGISWNGAILFIWTHALGGVFNYFGDHSGVLYLFALATCAVLTFPTRELVKRFTWPAVFWLLWIATSITLVGLTFKYGQAASKAKKIEHFDRKQDHRVITNIPENFKAVSVDLASIKNRLETREHSFRREPEVVEGTVVTLSALKDAFPFGFIVVFSRDGHLTYKPFPSDKLQWDIDLNELKISADFAAQKVNYTLSSFTTSFLKDGKMQRGFGVSNVHVVTSTPLAVGATFPLTLFVGRNDDPEPFGAIIGTNQRAPVFVIGFRIQDRTR